MGRGSPPAADTGGSWSSARGAKAAGTSDGRRATRRGRRRATRGAQQRRRNDIGPLASRRMAGIARGFAVARGRACPFRPMMAANDEDNGTGVWDDGNRFCDRRRRDRPLYGGLSDDRGPRGPAGPDADSLRRGCCSCGRTPWAPCAWRGPYVAEPNVLNLNVEMRFWNGTTSRVYARQAETPRLRDLRFSGMSGMTNRSVGKAVQARPRGAAVLFRGSTVRSIGRARRVRGTCAARRLTGYWFGIVRLAEPAGCRQTGKAVGDVRV